MQFVALQGRITARQPTELRIALLFFLTKLTGTVRDQLLLQRTLHPNESHDKLEKAVYIVEATKKSVQDEQGSGFDNAVTVLYILAQHPVGASCKTDPRDRLSKLLEMLCLGDMVADDLIKAVDSDVVLELDEALGRVLQLMEGSEEC